ncbi:hypothetical protein [Mesorhizobium ciceri]|uniref:hypothetical protein n=1 Tax=Mesorhizobium TaxID=68287 RepID=UPI00047BCA92|nr:hypothetical protein [Mesorhizobium ciceri]
MTDIPEDILATANDIASLIPSRVSADNRTFAGLVIARAILAERERCAQIAITVTEGTSRHDDHPVRKAIADAISAAGKIIATAIRTPSTPKRADT